MELTLTEMNWLEQALLNLLDVYKAWRDEKVEYGEPLAGVINDIAKLNELLAKVRREKEKRH